MSVKPKRPRCVWTEAMVADLMRLTAEGLKLDALTAAINERHGQTFSAQAVSCKRATLRPPTRVYQGWTQAADDALYSHAATMTYKQLRGFIKRETGTAYSIPAIKSRMLRLGITKRDADDEVIIADMASELGISQGRLSRFICYRNLPVRSGAKYAYLPPETQEALRAAFPKMPEPVMSIPEACKALHLSPQATHKRANDGRLKAYKFGAYVYVSVASVEAERRAMGIARPLPQTFGRPTATSKRTAS